MGDEGIGAQCKSRKAWGTAKPLKSAAEGGRSAGSDIECVDPCDLDITGCRGLHALQEKGLEEMPLLLKAPSVTAY